VSDDPAEPSEPEGSSESTGDELPEAAGPAEVAAASEADSDDDKDLIDEILD